MLQSQSAYLFVFSEFDLIAVLLHHRGQAHTSSQGWRLAGYIFSDHLQ